jgi:5-methylcytosine-specific restriction endonuclease McrA
VNVGRKPKGGPRRAVVDGVLLDPVRYLKSLKCVWRTYRPEEILPLIGEEPHRRVVIEFEGITYTANFSSLKLQNFKRSLVCVECGRVGVEFRAESANYEAGEGNLHLNLYSEDGVMMTKDHIIPACKGGWNGLDNTQTMCAECNVQKGDTSEVKYCCGAPGDDVESSGGHGSGVGPQEAIIGPIRFAALSDLVSSIIP